MIIKIKKDCKKTKEIIEKINNLKSQIEWIRCDYARHGDANLSGGKVFYSVVRKKEILDFFTTKSEAKNFIDKENEPIKLTINNLEQEILALEKELESCGK